MNMKFWQFVNKVSSLLWICALGGVVYFNGFPQGDHFSVFQQLNYQPHPHPGRNY